VSVVFPRNRSEAVPGSNFCFNNNSSNDISIGVHSPATMVNLTSVNAGSFSGGGGFNTGVNAFHQQYHFQQPHFQQQQQMHKEHLSPSILSMSAPNLFGCGATIPVGTSPAIFPARQVICKQPPIGGAVVPYRASAFLPTVPSTATGLSFALERLHAAETAV
jgi:hypothetical protein